jgi:methionine synthase II (cobalamin-independent)
MKAKRIRCIGHVAHLLEELNAYKILVCKPEGKRPRIELCLEGFDSIKVTLKEIGYGVIWLRLWTSGGLS